MKILVTGGAGYVGSITTAHLLQAGHEVTVVDNLSTGHKDAIPDGASFLEADIRNTDAYVDALHDVEVVIHFAGLIAAGESMAKPELYWDVNVVGSLKLMDAMRQAGVKKLIFSSSAAVYGTPASVPIDEEAQTNPTSTYGMTKLTIDMALASECLAHDLAAVSLRYFNVAGAYRRWGERHPDETHIIPLAFKAVTTERLFKLFGDDYPTPDRTCVRDYIHVADLARAHVLALQKLEAGTHHIYNLGNGNGFSNKEVIRIVKQVTRGTLDVVNEPRRPGDPETLIASSEKAKIELGWQPEKPQLESIIQDAWDYYKTTQP